MSRPFVPPPTRTPVQSMLREIAPIILLLIGALTGIVWTISLGGRLNSSPPYLFITGIAMAVALLLATRGAPRWGYPWMAMGIVGTQALLWALLAPEDGEFNVAVGIATLGGPILAAVIGGAIATRSWGDSAFFAGLYLAGAYLALPIVLLPPESGARTDIETSRALVALGQAGLTAASILLWNRGRVPQALAALGAVVLVSAIAAGVLVPGSRDDVPEDLSTFFGASQGPFRIALIVLLISFAIGGARRFISGRGLLAPQIPPIDMTEEEEDEYGRTALLYPSDAAEDEPEADTLQDSEDGDSSEPPTRPRRRRRRRRRE
ncbi:MAG: hypothetical protein F4X20_01695 [Dehalococcoidia bacterium]|nr:hypothetical protein [Dehalococcoidia bacterium]